jgi:L-amino acid N-acyltransferase YncA
VSGTGSPPFRRLRTDGGAEREPLTLPRRRHTVVAMDIRPADGADWPGIWEIFRVVVAAGDTYSYDPDTPEEKARTMWTAAPARAYVAVDPASGAVAGTYTLRPNQPGLGSHVANAGFMVAPGLSGRGTGRALGEHALAEARRLGFLAMQFNFVVSTNERAVRLWQSLGFAIAGTVPGAFRHRERGLVDVHVMHRWL